jgi:two-component system, chemotaxis family, sensor kinase CheA
MAIDDNKLRLAYLEEVTELLENLNTNLLAIEEDPKNKDVINEIFRLTHSIKSSSALIGYNNIAGIAHKMEDIFEKVRREELIVDRNICDSLFYAFDRMAVLVAAVQNNNKESDYDVDDVIVPLQKLLSSEHITEVKKEEKKVEAAAGASSLFNSETPVTSMQVSHDVLKDFKNVNFNDLEKVQIEEGLEKNEKFYKIIYHIQDECDMRYPRAYLVYNNYLNSGNIVKVIPDLQNEVEDSKLKDIEIYLLTVEDEKKLAECAEVDQIDKVNIMSIDLNALKTQFDLNISIEKPSEEGHIVETELKVEKNIDVPVIEVPDHNVAEEIKVENNESQPQHEHKTGVKKVGGSELKEIQKQTIRVDIEKLDNMMNLIGELIISRSRFSQLLTKINDQSSITEIKSDIEDATNQLDRITDEMQNGIMQTRMVPIGNVFSRFPRLVRDLANNLRKNVELIIIGENTEIDRTVIEMITDPLTHIIKNCIDHGIEMPDERSKYNKNREGQIILKAYQEGSNIFIEISDDGKGMDIEAIKSKILEKGLLSSQLLGKLSEKEILNYVFEPGFSTKKEVTSVSGRGVGMDVVKTQIQKLRGKVDIETALGKGSKIIIALPLTLTIIEVLLVYVKKNIFAIPISIIEETVKAKAEDIREFEGYHVYNLRGDTLPIMFLANLVGLQYDIKKGDIYIVVIEFDRKKIGLVVNSLIGEQDIVIKALDEILQTNEGIAGASVLGDGSVALILDVNNLIKTAAKTIRNIHNTAMLENGMEELESLNLDDFFDDLNNSSPVK